MEPQSALTNVSRILELTPAECRLAIPVRLRGMVTCYDYGRVLFVQDESAGIFVYYTGDRLALQPEQEVEVTGVTSPGRYSPVIASASIRVVESGPRAKPRAASLGEVYLGALDAQWVEVTAVVRTQRIMENRLRLELAEAPYRISLWIPDYRGIEQLSLPGSVVRVRCVVGIGVNARDQVEGFQLFCNSLADVVVLARPPADIFSAPACTLGNLKTWSARRNMSGLVHVRGVVTLSRAEGEFFVQDSSGGVEVQTQGPSQPLTPGTGVEVVGYLGSILEPPRIEDAVVRTSSTNQSLVPVRAEPEDLFSGRYHDQLVEVDAEFLGLAQSSSNALTMDLRAGPHLFSAQVEGSSLPPEFSRLESGYGLHLTGVSISDSSPSTSPGVSLLLRSPTDLQVLGPGRQPASNGLHILAATALLTTVSLACALWFLQRQRRRTEELLGLQVSLQTEMRQSEQQLRRGMEERERFARDLHDDIIQSIYAVGLNLEECRRMIAPAPAQAEARLASAIEALNNSIRRVRSFIVGLEPKVLNGREFKTALKSLALTSGEGPTEFCIDVDPSRANALKPREATELLCIAKEAMSNSLRHARAARITVSLQPAGTGVRLGIYDDGVGFDPTATIRMGQGLRNMAARAREIGADFQILSSNGQGCRILVTLAQRTANECS